MSSSNSVAWLIVLAASACGGSTQSEVRPVPPTETARTASDSDKETDFTYGRFVVHPGELPPATMLNEICAELAGAIHRDRPLIAKLRRLTEQSTAAETDSSVRTAALDSWKTVRGEVDLALARCAVDVFDDIETDRFAHDTDAGSATHRK